jgi:replicative DNA helicase
MIDVLKTGLPANIESERIVLGFVFADDSLYPQAAAVLSADDFSVASHSRIFRVMAELYEGGSRIDPVTVGNHLNAAGKLQAVGGLEYLSKLVDPLTSILSVEPHLRIVKEKSILRRCIYSCQELIDQALLNGESSEIIDRAERVGRDLSAKAVGDRSLFSAGMIFAEVGGLDGFLELTRTQGIQTPWVSVNRYIGLRPKELTIVAARPAVGKTAAAMQIAEYAAQHGVGVAVFSLEMSRPELLMRMICSRAMVDSNRFRRNELDYGERQSIAAAAAQLNALPIWYDDQSACTVVAVQAALQRLRARHPIGLVVIDYLQLMTALGRHQNRTEQVSSISRGLKIAATEFNVPFVVLSQLTRASEHEGRRPQLSDLRDSGSLEQDANNVIFLHLKEKNYGQVRPIELIIAKQRNGPVGKFDMVFHANYCRLQESTDGDVEREDHRAFAAGERAQRSLDTGRS